MTTTRTIRVNTGSDGMDTAIGLAMLTFFVSLPAAWITHYIWIIKTLASDKGVTGGQIALGGLGAFMPPIGIIHGYMIWFGVGF